MKKSVLYILTLAIILSSCSPYQKLLKSADNKAKYDKAKEYYEKKDYMRAATLLESAAPHYKGTQEAGPILFLLANCYYGNKSYQTAINYYSAYNSNYPKGEHAMESRYMIGHSYYLMSPDTKLDQSATYSSVEAFQTFLELYPYSERISEASKYQLEMYEKLSHKELLNAQLYYKLGNYQGNNYQSAIIVSQNVLKNYPFTKYREEFLILILRSKYMQAVKSIEKRKNERYREAIDEYFVYSGEFPQGKYIKEAEKIHEDSEKYINK
ncbi:MAG: outer membrane protein assembly factor BamD [Bacteroidales bacterium]|jgi:outer membrane protein assembly factor BamD|nr:outer membrane protein assembly factor BamD [Bacteroidales bacterium]